MKSNENIVTVKKVVDNLKSKWWILVITVFFAIFVIFYSNRNENQETMYTVKTFLCVQEVADESKESLSDAIILEENKIKNDNLMNQNAIYITKMMKSLVQSEEIKDEVLLYMKERGQEDFFTNTELKFFAESRMIECTVEMENIEKAVAVINSYSAVLCEKINEILEGEQISVIEYADQKNYVTEKSSLFSIKNIFILLISICGGLSCILLIVLTDKKVREPYEIENIAPVEYWGRVRKGKRHDEDVAKIRTIIEKRKREKDKIVFAALNNDSSIVNSISELAGERTQEVEVLFLQGREKELKRTIDIKSIVLVLCGGKDKIPDVEEVFVWLSAMGIEVEGYLFID